ncbi:MAG: hypothetical protein L3K08_04220, partial [Thermoplasmata archaeon]|nr:hypothetical protein [Thermoplasmata archaeon]
STIITTPQTACDGIHFTNVNRATLDNILVHGANGVSPGGALGSGTSPYTLSETGYGGIVLDFFGFGSQQPGEVNLGYLTCEQGASDGLGIYTCVTIKAVAFELSNNGLAGLRIHASKGLNASTIVCNSNIVAGILGEDDLLGSGFHLQNNTLSNVTCR